MVTLAVTMMTIYTKQRPGFIPGIFYLSYKLAQNWCIHFVIARNVAKRNEEGKNKRKLDCFGLCPRNDKAGKIASSQDPRNDKAGKIASSQDPRNGNNHRTLIRSLFI